MAAERRGWGWSPFHPALRLAIGAIVRNEAPYLLEWIAHHRALGVGRFFLADNGSTDGTTALLARLARAGVVDHLPFPSEPGRPPQQAAYGAILARFGAAADWIAFIDADEFLRPAGRHRLGPVLARLGRRPEVGAVAVNWAVYGSAGERLARPEPVTQRFSRRAAGEDPLNRHYKSILRPEAATGSTLNVHAFPLRPGRIAVHADGSPLATGCAPAAERAPDTAPQGTGLSARTVWAPVRLDHYVIKSRQEFDERKRPRGRATAPGAFRDEVFFRFHDRNAVLDPPARRLLRATAAERRRLEARLAALD